MKITCTIKSANKASTGPTSFQKTLVAQPVSCDVEGVQVSGQFQITGVEAALDVNDTFLIEATLTKL